MFLLPYEAYNIIKAGTKESDYETVEGESEKESVTVMPEVDPSYDVEIICAVASEIAENIEKNDMTEKESEKMNSDLDSDAATKTNKEQNADLSGLRINVGVNRNNNASIIPDETHFYSLLIALQTSATLKTKNKWASLTDFQECFKDCDTIESKKISNDQELIQSDPTSCPQNQNGNN